MILELRPKALGAAILAFDILAFASQMSAQTAMPANRVSFAPIVDSIARAAIAAGGSRGWLSASRTAAARCTRLVWALCSAGADADQPV